MASEDLRARIAAAIQHGLRFEEADGDSVPIEIENAVMAELAQAQALNDDAWGSVWLHGKWSWLTKNMTTEEREHAADSVARWSARLDAEDGEPDPGEPEGLRWWREPERPTCTCRGLPMGPGQTCNAHQMKETRR